MTTQPESNARRGGRSNRLAGEASPYLLQHANNPVDWRPWGEEAFEEARRRGVPIFLSIGYSTCYWCHVMERESFENEAIAAIMNEHFVCIKVDREERPDVDEIYMAATLIMNGHGGWPMSVFLEPGSLKPFWCGTYFPAEVSARTGNRPSFPQILMGLSKAWREQRDDVMAQSAQIAADVAQHLAADAKDPADVGAEEVSRAVSQLLNMFDRLRGGFGQAPKFPQPVFLEYLLAVRPRATDDSTADAIDEALRRTLDRMMIGGIHDQAGGGFHRYSVDAEWLVPHFEKMLYDNAQLLAVYAAAARYYGDNEYERAARRIVEYADREMTRGDGAFYSAQDAEVDGREGLNYLWTPDELRSAVPRELAEFAIAVYGLDKGANFQDPHHQDEPARNILRLADRPDRLARSMQMSAETFRERIDAVNAALLEKRSSRRQPGLDDKVITAWNAMMIWALAVAGRELEDPSLTDRAERAMTAVLSCANGGPEGLLRSHRGDRPGPRGVLEDHAWMVRAACELSRARGEPADGSGKWTKTAKDLASVTLTLFTGDGRPFDTREDDTTLFIRACSTHDGATPSGASVLLHALLDLYERTGEHVVSDAALAVMRWCGRAIAESPLGAVHATHALFRMLSGGIPGVDQLGAGRAATPGAPEAALAAGSGSGGPSQPAEEPPVEIYAPEDRIVLREGTPGELTVMIKVRDGLHVIAADPGEHGAGLTPLRVRIIGGGGVSAYADYPAGEWYGVEGVGKIRVNSGSFDVRIALERDGEWSGRPMLAITYQACSDTECLRPVTTELDIALDRG